MLQKASSLFGLLLIAAFFFAATLLGSEEQTLDRAIPASLPAIGSAGGSDRAALIQLFGCEVPYSSAGGYGTVQDAALGSLNVRVYRWQGTDGLTVAAVQPAEAASLLRPEGMTADTDTKWSLGNAVLMTAEGNGSACAWYSTDDAAYTLTLSNADTDRLLALLATDVTFPR